MRCGCLPWVGSERDETQKAQAKANSGTTTYRRHFLPQSFGCSAHQAGSPPESFTLKEPPALDADLFIMEEGLLTPLERKILSTIVELGTIKAVAEHLYYNPTTIKRYLCRIYKKLRVRTAPQATALTRLGLI